MTMTVIIPTYNRAGFIGRAVASVLRCSCALPLDVVVIDDGSTDGTAEVCADLAARHPEVRVLRQENTGVAGARNLGLRSLLPETAFVTFLDSDDMMLPDRFAQDLALLQADPDVDMTYGRMMQVTEIDDTALAPTVASVQSVARLTQLSAGLYRRALIDRTGFFAEDMEQAEDTDFLFRMFEEGARFVETDTICAYYVRHFGNMTNNRAISARCTKAAMLRAIKRRRDDPTRRRAQPTMEGDMLPPPEGAQISETQP